jgi:hypothetical protein
MYSIVAYSLVDELSSPHQESYWSDPACSDPSWEPPVRFRPSFVRFESADIYGAVPLPPLLNIKRSSLSLPMMEEATMGEETNAEAPGATTVREMTRDV